MNCLQIFLCVMAFHVAWFCPLSRDSVTYVSSCPKSQEEWKQRAELKKCSQFRQSCNSTENFVYHCVINNFANASIEVCALETHIIDHRCAEFNIKAGIIVESYAKKCNSSCPFKYKSTEAYKYQVCYDMAYQICSCYSTNPTDPTYSTKVNEFVSTISSIRSTMKMEDMCSATTYYIILAVIAVIAPLFLISFLSNMWFVYRCKRNRKKSKDEDNEDKFTKKESFPLLPGVDEVGVSEISETKVADGSKEEPFVIAIDIGEKYLGLADPNNPSTVIPLHPMERISVLIKKPDKIIAVGSKATKLYIKMRDEDVNDHVYINEVKQKDIENEVEIKGTIFQTKDIFVAAIAHALELVRDESNTSQNNQDIKIALTAAGHWSTLYGKLKTLVETIEHRQIREEMIFFMEKVQTISPFIREVQASSTCLNFNVDNLRIDGSIYAILNVGYGSCHLTFLQGGLHKNELHDIKSGGIARSEWGKHAPEEKVWSFCQKILNEKYINPQNYERIKSQFDFHHEKLRKCQGDGTPFHFTILKGKSTGKVLTKEKVDGIKIRDKEKQFTIIFNWKQLKECFRELVDQVDKVIENNRESSFKLYNVKCVFLIGGYNNLDFIQRIARKTWFPKITVVIPNDGGVCFAMGAASACARNLLPESVTGKT